MCFYKFKRCNIRQSWNVRKDATNFDRKIYLLGSADGHSLKNNCLLSKNFINLDQKKSYQAYESYESFTSYQANWSLSDFYLEWRAFRTGLFFIYKIFMFLQVLLKIRHSQAFRRFPTSGNFHALEVKIHIVSHLRFLVIVYET